jgi:hypothetical protein
MLKIWMYKSIIRPTVTCGCETWTMSVIEQNCLLVFERRVLRRIYGPTQGWNMEDKNKCRIRNFNQERKYCKIYKITKTTMSSIYN